MCKRLAIHDAQKDLIDKVTQISEGERHVVYRKNGILYLENMDKCEVWGEWFVNVLKGNVGY